MKLQLASDLHLELVERSFPGERLIAPAADADVLVLAGDIDNGVRAVKLFGDWPVPVLYVAGNHEFYGTQWEAARAKLRTVAEGTRVVFLDNQVADLSRFTHWASSRVDELERVRFLGCTLWTDYRYHLLRPQSELMKHAEEVMADHSRIWTAAGRFRARQALADHERSRAWLECELAKPFNGKTVVVTHHGPHPMSIHPRYLNPVDMPANAAFISDQSQLMKSVDLWLHGHTHDSFNYTVGRCRVAANPRGYPLNRSNATKASELLFENPHFQSVCVLEV